VGEDVERGMERKGIWSLIQDSPRGYSKLIPFGWTIGLGVFSDVAWGEWRGDGTLMVAVVDMAGRGMEGGYFMNGGRAF